MLSDSLLATNRFVTPLPGSQVWVLGTYYAAQALIVSGWLAGLAHSSAAQRAVKGEARANTPMDSNRETAARPS